MYLSDQNKNPLSTPDYLPQIPPRTILYLPFVQMKETRVSDSMGLLLCFNE